MIISNLVKQPKTGAVFPDTPAFLCLLPNCFLGTERLPLSGWEGQVDTPGRPGSSGGPGGEVSPSAAPLFLSLLSSERGGGWWPWR